MRQKKKSFQPKNVQENDDDIILFFLVARFALRVEEFIWSSSSCGFDVGAASNVRYFFHLIGLLLVATFIMRVYKKYPMFCFSL